MSASIHHGDCLEVLRAMPADSIDAIVTDPPYGLSDHKPAEVLECLKAWIAGEPYTPKGKGFMGKGWDAWVPGPEVWRECMRVLKPGGHLLAFAGTRSMDLMCMSVRLAGFELRDSIGYASDGGDTTQAPIMAWTFGSGFPKSLDVSKAIDKAAGVERETLQQGERSSARPVVEGQSGNKAYRLAGDASIAAPTTDAAKRWQGWGTALKPAWEPIILARKPFTGTVASNVLAHGTGALNIDGGRVPLIDGEAPAGSGDRRGSAVYAQDEWTRTQMANGGNATPAAGRWPANLLHDGSPEVVAPFPDSKGSGPARQLKRGQRDDAWGMADLPGDLRDAGSGSAARFFYCSKASRKDRGEGNTHVTVKPTDLMRYLCRLVTPPGGIVLDPFMGSGSTGKAAVLEGFSFVGIEREAEYVAIAEARIASASTPAKTATKKTDRRPSGLTIDLFAGETA